MELEASAGGVRGRGLVVVLMVKLAPTNLTPGGTERVLLQQFSVTSRVLYMRSGYWYHQEGTVVKYWRQFIKNIPVTLYYYKNLYGLSCFSLKAATRNLLVSPPSLTDFWFTFRSETKYCKKCLGFVQYHLLHLGPGACGPPPLTQWVGRGENEC